jgi:hypothetical protein
MHVTIIVSDLIYSDQISSLTIFIHGLVKDKSHKYHIIVRILFCIYDYVTS